MVNALDLWFDGANHWAMQYLDRTISHAFERAGRLRVSVVGVIAASCISICTAFAAPASASVFADYRLHPPCCNDDLLLGTRASIKTPSTPVQFGATECVAYRSVAESSTLALIQTGFVACAPNATVRGTCATVNKHVQFVETIDLAVVGHCYSHGQLAPTRRCCIP